MPDDIAAMSLKSIARALGGEATGGQVLCPGPGHGPKDRSLAVKPDSSAPGGFVVFSHADDDPIACKDYVREQLGLPAFAPRKSTSNGKGRGRKKVTASP